MTNEKFGARSTADDVLAGVDLRGRRILVTGVSSGLGRETARALAARGADVVGTARDRGKAEGTVIELDLASLRSVHAAADQLVADGRPLHAIIANAGVMATPFARTQDGFERQLGTNHLGHFALVSRLAALLADDGRIVVLSSNAHRAADVDLDDPSFERTAYDPWIAYGRSKTANALFAVELDRRLRHRGIRACAVMPGVAWTGLAQHLTPELLASLSASIDADRAAAGLPALEPKSIAQAAATTVYAATVADADEVGGRYLEDCRVAPVDDTPGFRDGVMSYALDPARAAQLWDKSEALIRAASGATG